MNADKVEIVDSGIDTLVGINGSIFALTPEEVLSGGNDSVRLWTGLHGDLFLFARPHNYPLSVWQHDAIMGALHDPPSPHDGPFTLWLRREGKVSEPPSPGDAPATGAESEHSAPGADKIEVFLLGDGVMVASGFHNYYLNPAQAAFGMSDDLRLCTQIDGSKGLHLRYRGAWIEYLLSDCDYEMILSAFRSRGLLSCGTLVLHLERAGDVPEEDPAPASRSDMEGVAWHAAILIDACHGVADERGWWTDPETGAPLVRSVPELLCLIHSEVSEALEAHRKGLTAEHIAGFSGLEEELADVVIRVCDMAGGMNLNLGGAIAAKLRYNQGRPDHDPDARLSAGGKRY